MHEDVNVGQQPGTQLWSNKGTFSVLKVVHKNWRFSETFQ